ncbi:hypothetical protein Bhyg_03056, partial [Pseudolycoriella hygida]
DSTTKGTNQDLYEQGTVPERLSDVTHNISSKVNNPMAKELEVEKFDLNEQERLFRLVRTWMMKKTSSFYEKKKATSTRRARQPQRRNSSSSDSEEVAENILIAKELEKNYLHESDYSVDDEAADAVMNEVVVASSSRTSSRQKTIGTQTSPDFVNNYEKVIQSLVKENRGLKTAIKNLQENRAKQPTELFPDLNDKLKSDDTIVLKSLFSSAQSNANRTKYGQRYYQGIR